MIRQGSAPNFAPPVQEGVVFTFTDEKGEQVNLEFLGLILHGNVRYGFFFPVDETHHSGDSGEVVILEVTELDEEGQPSAFELLDDEEIAREIYSEFQVATKDLYDFA